jgi:hypothetical protein
MAMERPTAPDRPVGDDRRLFRVYFEGELIESYDPDRYPTARDVTDDLADRWASLLPEGGDEWDLVVWRVGRAVAVVRTGPEGGPEVTIFADIPG